MVAGLLLAAGAGRRMGMPKALVDDWLVRSIEVLREGGCEDVLVVLGAAAEEARARLPEGQRVVVADDWDDGMGASLRVGLAALGPGVEVAVVHLVDLPDVGADVVARVVAAGSAGGLARAAYAGVPGHPVLIGRDHWAGVLETAVGDQGARSYLKSHDVRLVECGDLAGGNDVDRR
ncbi:NTP transferase domain-containing protein [Nocardioides sp. NPDC101246]|uniref:nucleotidyltransferase family protein n=1 Tax=Nocardioides sp. NPDC101246 TaxID=3364336 RepID=UPI0037FE5213